MELSPDNLEVADSEHFWKFSRGPHLMRPACLPGRNEGRWVKRNSRHERANEQRESEDDAARLLIVRKIQLNLRTNLSLK